MGCTTVKTALSWVATPYGKKVDQDRDVLLGVLNDIRHHFYLLYDEVQLFMTADECFQVQEFCSDCNDCDSSYPGISLPRDMQTIESIWINNRPIPMRSKWREYSHGINLPDDCKVSAINIGSEFPTELEMECGSCHKIGFIASSHEDYGKTVSVEIINSDGVRVLQEVDLGESTRATDEVAKSITRVILPEDLKGSVHIAAGGRLLSEYSPVDSIPSFTRYKIIGVKPGDQVLVRAAKKYRPLFHDSDVVETDNKLAIVEMAKYFRGNASSDAETVSLSRVFATNARNYLLAEKERDVGKSTREDISFRPKRTRRAGLPRNRIGYRGIGRRSIGYRGGRI